MIMKKICIVTGTRAEYGLLKPLIDRVILEEGFKLQLIVTGMHLSPEFGMTYDSIVKDGYVNIEKVEILLSSDTAVGISKSMGLAMISFAEIFDRLKPDIIVILGDRYEMLAVATSAMIGKIPIAHIHGGETTEGAIDEAIRHSITKMSFLHFTSTQIYRKRVIQLGENPKNVYNVGAIGIENIKNLKLLSKKEIEEKLNLKFDKKIFLVTFHPVTLDNISSENQFKNLLLALDKIKDAKIIFTKANSDTDGRIINKMIDEYVEKHKENTIAFISMGQLNYLSAMKYASLVIGNSSSGIIEAPSFRVPTINIGDRQKGRIQSETTINCICRCDEIVKAITYGLSKEFKVKIKDSINPYGDGIVSSKIIEVIKRRIENIDIKKRFYDL